MLSARFSLPFQSGGRVPLSPPFFAATVWRSLFLSSDALSRPCRTNGKGTKSETQGHRQRETEAAQEGKQHKNMRKLVCLLSMSPLSSSGFQPSPPLAFLRGSGTRRRNKKRGEEEKKKKE